MSVEQIIIRTSPGETLTALVSKGRLIEIHMDRAGRASLVGNVYLGRVQAVQQSLDAAFVAIGESRDGFLALPEARPVGKTGGRISDYVNEGDTVLVQVQRDPIEEKGAKLTTHIHLAGTFLVLRPLQAGVSVSQRIFGKDKHNHLSKIASNLAPKDGGFIVRTKAGDSIDREINKDATHLIACWQKMIREINSVRAPARIFEEVDPACKAIRDFGSEALREIIVDGADTLCSIMKFCKTRLPWLPARISSYKGSGDIFEFYGISEQIDAAFITQVDLIGGGVLIINQTPALCAIDVNTGGADGISHEQTAFDVNSQAATEVALQIRLRNISGLILVDFVSLRDSARRNIILEILKEAAIADPFGVNVAGFTRLGLVEMTRQRHGLSLQHVICGLDMPEILKSSESQAINALRLVMSEVRNCAQIRGCAKVLLRAPLSVIAELEGFGENKSTSTIALNEAQDRLGLVIKLEPDQNLAEGQFEVIVGDR